MTDYISELLSRADEALRKSSFAELSEHAKQWPPGEQDEAKQLLLWWFALADQGRSRKEIEATILEYFFQEYERWLRSMDAAVQEECAKNPPSRLEKLWGDPCEPMFGGKTPIGKSQIFEFKQKLAIFSCAFGGSVYGKPHDCIIKWYEEYRFRKDILRQLRAQAIADAFGGLALVYARVPMARRGTSGRKPRTSADGGGKRSATSLGRAPEEPKILLPEDATKAAANLGKEVAKAAAKGARGSTSEKPSYRIGEGVRRAVIAREAGQSDVDAIVVGSVNPKMKVPLDRLYVPPTKGSIARDTRYVNLVRSIAETGQTAPIEVTPISPEASQKLVPLSQVKLVKSRGM